jgi:hypothetical protein
MRRFAHGVTTSPSPARPTNGYGRTLRPGPDRGRAVQLLDEARVLEARGGEPRRP